MREAKAQIRLRSPDCAVWSGPSLSADRIIGYYLMDKMERKDPDDTLHMRMVVWILAFMRMFEDTFSLDTALTVMVPFYSVAYLFFSILLSGPW